MSLTMAGVDPARRDEFALADERVSFTCGGQLINSWAMIYPKSERRFYNRVVEAVARTYSPGAGRTGQCD